MVGGCNSLSILSYSTRYYSHLHKSQTPQKLQSNSNYKPFKFRAMKNSLAMEVDKQSSLEPFLQSNSVADFMRFKEGSSELQTAVVSYQKKLPSSIPQILQVDLVTTVHIADREYFAALQKELEHYDCVIYEMLAKRKSFENERIGSQSLKSQDISIIGFIQDKMASILKLDSQLDCLDYKHENWYNADLDFGSPQRGKDESFFTFARDLTLKSANVVGEATSIPEELGPWKSKLLWASRFLPIPLVGVVAINKICGNVGNEPADLTELQALSRLDVLAAMKIFLARNLTSDFTDGTPDLKSLQRAIDMGHSKIAILYSSARMPDLARRLKDEFDLAPSQVRWLTAWSIKNQTLASNSFPFLRKLGQVLGWPLDRYQTVALVMISSIFAMDLWLWQLIYGTAIGWIIHFASDSIHFDTHLSL